MESRIPQSVVKRVPFKAFLSSDHVTPATGKTIPVQVSKNGAGFANLDTPSNATEIGAGWYYINLATADIDTLGPLIVRGTEGTIDPAEVVYDVVDPRNAGFTALPAAVADAAGGLPISTAGSLDMDAILADTSDLQGNKGAWLTATSVTVSDKTGFSLVSTGLDLVTAWTVDITGTISTVTAVTGLDTGAITDSAFASGAITAGAFAANALVSATFAADYYTSINNEAKDVLFTDTYAEPSDEAVPSTLSIGDGIRWLFKGWRNKKHQDSDDFDLYNAAGDNIDQNATISDDGTDFIKDTMTGTG